MFDVMQGARKHISTGEVECEWVVVILLSGSSPGQTLAPRIGLARLVPIPTKAITHFALAYEERIFVSPRYR